MHLHFNVAHSKGQSQGHANFDCNYLENGDRANITIVDRYEVAYWVSNGVFTFGLGLF